MKLGVLVIVFGIILILLVAQVVQAIRRRQHRPPPQTRQSLGGQPSAAPAIRWLTYRLPGTTRQDGH